VYFMVASGDHALTGKQRVAAGITSVGKVSILLPANRERARCLVALYVHMGDT
jgi:hypothetical protein